MKRTILSFCVLVFFAFSLSSKEKDFPDLKGPYLGQKPPGITPEIFAPGLISTHLSQSYIAFLKGARVCVFSTSTERGHETYYTYEKDGFWTKPERAPFEELQGHPNYTTGPLGRKVYYHSGNPTNPDDAIPDDNIWSIEWIGSGWAEPAALPAPANSEYGEAYPSATSDGTVYFFTWRREGTRGDDIWFSRCVDGQYQEAERLPWPINTDFIEYDPYVAPDESFLIFASDRPGGYGSSDNYICFRKDDGSWTCPINLGRTYNSSSYDLCANGTPDGKYFFFTSGRKTDVDKGEIGMISGKKPKDDADLYWADFSFIEDLKNTLFTKQNAAKIIQEDYRKSGIQSAVNTLNRLYNNQNDTTYFLPFELLSLTKDMLLEDEIKDADLFCSALEKLFPKDLSIKEGYARLCAVNGYISKGLKIFEELDTEDPNFDLNDVLSSLGYLLTLYPEKTEDALSVLQFTVEKFPEDPWAYFNLARIYRQLGDLDKAIENCRKSLELEPSVGDISQLLERLLEEKEKQEKRSFPVLKGPYLGQKPPGITPEIFAPGIVSTGHSERIAAFTPDGREFYFAIWGAPHGVILCMREVDGRWTKPEVAPFSGKYQGDFTMSSDGKTIVFSSNSPFEGYGEPQENYYSWIVKRTENSWGKPMPFGPSINSPESFAGCPTIADSGNLYFFSDRSGGCGNDDIWVSKYADGQYSDPVNLGRSINSIDYDLDPFIAPDESYIVFARIDKERKGAADLFISFRKDNGSWTKAKNMGEGINSPDSEYCPTVSPDGKYFFFTSTRRSYEAHSKTPLTYEQKLKILNNPGNGLADIYWVDAMVIEKLKAIDLN